MTSPEFTANRDNYCYRHPDRQSFVLCQRCVRTICPQCQTQGPVGVICPECLAAQRKAETPGQKRARRAMGRGGARGGVVALRPGAKPVATLSIIALTTFVGILQLIPGLQVTDWLLFAAPYLYPQISPYPFEPWRLLTAALVHGGFWHLGLNMLALWMIGQSLEPILGRWRFVLLYIVSALGGSVAVAVIAPTTATVGASGAVFGLMAALLVIGRHLGANVTGILVILGINLVLGFVPGFNIAWQAHVGGALVGALIGFLFTRTRQRKQRTLQIVLLALVVLVLLVIVAFVPPAILLAR